MILNNTQANIFKVNGGIANNFANRPAASGSFYIFYSIDTQEIYYDNGAWILIAGVSIPPPSVNIYNTDGTLTANRQLNANNLYFLYFNDLSIFRVTSNQGVNASATLSVTGGSVRFQSIDVPSNIFRTLTTDPSQVSIRNFTNISGQPGLNLKMTENRFIISTNFSNYVNNFGSGINLNFTNRRYEFGQITGNNRVFFRIDDTNSIIETWAQGIDTGLKLDFATRTYQIGQLSGGNRAYLQIDDSFPSIRTYFFGNAFPDGIDLNPLICQLGYNVITTLSVNAEATTNSIFAKDITGNNGFLLEFTPQLYKYGHLPIGNNLYSEVDNLNKTAKFYNNGVNDGLSLNYTTKIFDFGSLTALNNSYLRVDGTNNRVWTRLNGVGYGFYTADNFGNPSVTIGRWASFSGFKLNIQDGQIETTQAAGERSGILFRTLSEDYYFGAIDRGNKTTLNIQDTNKLIFTSNNSVVQGLSLNLNTSVMRLGNFGVGQGYIDVQANDFTLQNINNIIVNGSVLSASSSGFSGQHLIIRVNGVNYKIRLEN